MDSTVVTAAIYMLAFLPACLFGVWMRRSQRIELLSGIDVARVPDRARLARFVGNILIAIGATGLVAGMAIAAASRGQIAILVVSHAVVVNALVVVLILGVRRLAGPRA